MSSYEAKERRRNIIVGIFVLVALGALVWLVWKFQDLPVRVSQIKSYKILMQVPSAPGIQENTPVRLGSYQIGRVTDVIPPQIIKDLENQKYYYQTRLELSINKKFQIPAVAEFKVMTRGLGSSYVEVSIEPEKLPDDPNNGEISYIEPGTVVQGVVASSSEFFPEESREKINELTDKMTQLLENANDILGDKENKENLKKSLANLSDATAEMTNSLKELQGFLASGKMMSEDLGRVMTQLQFTLNQINKGKGTAAKFINDGRLYESLLTSTEQLEELMDELTKLISEYREKGIRIKL